MARSFQSKLRVGKFADVIDRSWDSDPITSKLLGEVRANRNDPNSVIGQHLEASGLKRGSRGWFKGLDLMTEKLGRAIGGDNPQADIAMLKEEFLAPLGLRAPTGSGAWRPGIRGPEAEAAVKSAEVERAKGVAGAGAGVKEALSGDPAQFASSALGSMKNMQQFINSFDAGVENFSRAVDKFMGAVGYRPPTHAKGPTVTRIP
jgi:hypothetical protein